MRPSPDIYLDLGSSQSQPIGDGSQQRASCHMHSVTRSPVACLWRQIKELKSVCDVSDNNAKQGVQTGVLIDFKK
jgi:hypothetical protein